MAFRVAGGAFLAALFLVFQLAVFAQYIGFVPLQFVTVELGAFAIGVGLGAIVFGH
jgi:hypothetical protein